MSNIEYNIIYLTHGPTILIYQDPPKLGHQQVQVESLYQITNQLAIAGVLILEDPTKTPWKSSNTCGSHGIDPNCITLCKKDNFIKF